MRLPGGELEYSILAALWARGAGSVRDIHAHVGEPAGLAYTTTATVLDRLCLKGLVSREKVGRAFVYRPKAGRKRVEQARLKQVLRWLLGPEPQPAMARLVDAVESIRPELVEELGSEVRKRRRARSG